MESIQKQELLDIHLQEVTTSKNAIKLAKSASQQKIELKTRNFSFKIKPISLNENQNLIHHKSDKNNFKIKLEGGTNDGNRLYSSQNANLSNRNQNNLQTSKELNFYSQRESEKHQQQIMIRSESMNYFENNSEHATYMRKIMSFANSAVSCKNEQKIKRLINAQKQAPINSLNQQNPYITSCQQSIRDKHIQINSHRSDSRNMMRPQTTNQQEQPQFQQQQSQRTFRRTQSADRLNLQSSLSHRSSSLNQHQSEYQKQDKVNGKIGFDAGDYFDEIEKKLNREQLICHCHEHSKTNYKINALKRVLSHQQFIRSHVAADGDKQKLKNVNQLYKMLKPSLKLDYEKISKALDQHLKMESEIVSNEEQFRQTSQSFMQNHQIQRMKLTQSEFSKKIKRDKSLKQIIQDKYERNQSYEESKSQKQKFTIDLSKILNNQNMIENPNQLEKQTYDTIRTYKSTRNLQDQKSSITRRSQSQTGGRSIRGESGSGSMRQKSTSLSAYIQKIKENRKRRSEILMGFQQQYSQSQNSFSVNDDKRQNANQKKYLSIYLKPTFTQIKTPPLRDQKQVLLTNIRSQNIQEKEKKSQNISVNERQQSNNTSQFQNQLENSPDNKLVSISLFRQQQIQDQHKIQLQTLGSHINQSQEVNNAYMSSINQRDLNFEYKNTCNMDMSNQSIQIDSLRLLENYNTYQIQDQLQGKNNLLSEDQDQSKTSRNHKEGISYNKTHIDGEYFQSQMLKQASQFRKSKKSKIQQRSFVKQFAQDSQEQKNESQNGYFNMNIDQSSTKQSKPYRINYIENLKRRKEMIEKERKQQNWPQFHQIINHD